MNHLDYTRIQTPLNVIITYKNFPVSDNVSHIGLGVSALNCSKSLIAAGIPSDVWSILGAKQLAEKIDAARIKPSHIVISAPWIPTLDLQKYLVFKYPNIKFVVVCHSNVGFLQADPQGVKLFREALDLEQGALNFHAAGNTERFCNWVQAAYSRPCLCLPNLYFIDRIPTYRRPGSGGLLKIGMFGAIRPLKNMLSGGAAALELSNTLHTEIELHINAGSVEGGNSVVNSLEAMLSNVPSIKLVRDPWSQWSQFRRVVRSMNILFQPSYTESFNMVTADGASECIPSVVSDAIEWAPRYWKADVDDVLSISHTAGNLLTNMHSGKDGHDALVAHNAKSMIAWKNWLSL